MSYSQSGWFQQVSGVSNDLWSISITDSMNYWAVGSTPGNGVILRTSNGGLNWFQQTSPTTNSLFSCKFVNANTGWISGSGGVMLKTTNGGTLWVSQTSGSGVDLWALYFIDANTGFCGNTNGQIIKTTNSGSNWVLQTTTSGTIPSNFHFININTGYYAGILNSVNGGVYKTTNSGTSWTILSTGTIPTAEDVFFLNESTGWVCGQSGTIIKTTNGGNNWTNQSSGTSLNIFEIYFADQNTGWVVAGDAGNPSNGLILKTTNSGLNWYTQLTATGLYSINFNNNDIGVAVGKGGKIYKTTTSGELLPLAPTLISPSNNSTNVGLTPTLFWNTVSGATSYKVLVSSMLTFGNVIDSATVTTNQRTIPSGKLNVAATYYWKVLANNQYGSSPWSEAWNFSTVITSIVKTELEIPKSFAVSQNYPNPFNPATSIKFAIPKFSSVKITIFDIAGKELETIINEKLQAGTYQIEWNASKYSSGIYFYKIQTDNNTETKRMTLIK